MATTAQILETVQKRGKTSVKKTADEFDITPKEAKSALDELTREGHLQRVGRLYKTN